MVIPGREDSDTTNLPLARSACNELYSFKFDFFQLREEVMKKTLTLAAMAATFSFGAMAANFNGYIIDESCSTKPAMKGNVACAQRCIKGGSPAVLLTDDGKVYKIADQAKVTDYAGKKVTISGKMKDDTITVDKVSE